MKNLYFYMPKNSGVFFVAESFECCSKASKYYKEELDNNLNEYPTKVTSSKQLNNLKKKIHWNGDCIPWGPNEKYLEDFEKEFKQKENESRRNRNNKQKKDDCENRIVVIEGKKYKLTKVQLTTI